MTLSPSERTRLQETLARASNFVHEAQALSIVLARAFGSHRLGFDADELSAIDLTTEIVKDKVAEVSEQIEELSRIVADLDTAKPDGGTV